MHTPGRAVLLAQPLLSDSVESELSEHRLKETRSGYYIMTACLMVIAASVIYSGMDRLHSILVPFVLALALSYLLSPLVDLLSCRGASNSCRLPRIAAVFLAFLIGCVILFVLGLVLLEALYTFRARSSMYSARVNMLLEMAFTEVAKFQDYVGQTSTGSFHSINRTDANHSFSQEAREMVSHLVADVSVTSLILSLLGTAAHIAEDLLYIILFLMFMLLPHSTDGDGARDPVSERVERQIFAYIRGKSCISAYVGGSHAAVLCAVGLQGLWLPFGVLTFFLNFIPNVGGMGAVLLPMPLVGLDPSFTPTQSIVAFIVPFLNNVFAKDVLEPKILGDATNLHPVAILMAILVYGSVWGITGMVLAIPLTACLRIYLASLAHPIPQWVALKLSGKAPPPPQSPPNATLPRAIYFFNS